MDCHHREHFIELIRWKFGMTVLSIFWTGWLRSYNLFAHFVAKLRRWMDESLQRSICNKQDLYIFYIERTLRLVYSARLAYESLYTTVHYKTFTKQPVCIAANEMWKIIVPRKSKKLKRKISKYCVFAFRKQSRDNVATTIFPNFWCISFCLNFCAYLYWLQSSIYTEWLKFDSRRQRIPWSGETKTTCN